MKSKRTSLLFTLCAAMAAVTLTGCDLQNLTLDKILDPLNILPIHGGEKIPDTDDDDDPDPTPDPGPVDDHVVQYYSSINSNSSETALLSSLQSLNSAKLKTRVGYKPMLSNPSKGFYVTDPGNTSYTITAFYSGTVKAGTSGLNREHVWPASRTVLGRDNDPLENDIHMVRPTIEKENGSRGNSFYVEGKCSGSGGWDPAMEDFGLESYRGDSARIIFYCVVADSKLKLVDKEDDSMSNHTMGKLSDLLKWNLKYPVLEREKTRNTGAEGLQGNRNPFIDHPEYACKIWGNTNATTKQICGM